MMAIKPKFYTVLILAAGRAERWDGPIAKQLVDIDGIPLIVRTFRQVVDVFNVNPLVITASGDITLRFDHSDIFVPEESGFLVETLQSTASLWDGRVVVLLGDTYYRNYVLERIRDDDRPLMFYGRLLEIYALAFDHYIYLGKCLQTVIEQASNGQGSGKLWHLWYLMNGYPLDQHTLPNTANRYFQQLNPRDITMDIDTWDDYIKLKEVIEAGEVLINYEVK